jgi:ankyrin repeat protein
VPKIGLLKNHIDMVKYHNAQDSEYLQKVEPHLKTLVAKALLPRTEPATAQAERLFTAGINRQPRRDDLSTHPQNLSTLFSNNTGDEGNNPSSSQNTTPQFALLSTLNGLNADEASFWLAGLSCDLNSGAAYDQMLEVDQALEGTCDWIRDNQAYHNWLNASQNAVIFIQGGPGFGKSVLAKFLVEDIPRSLIEMEAPKTVVAHYFSKQGDRDNTPKTILMRLLSQVWRKDPTSFQRAALSLYNQFTVPQRDLRFYWSLLTAVRQYQESNLVCIVDGLDECIKSVKASTQTSIDSEMVTFIKKVCDIADEVGQQNSQTTTKVLFTTRFAAEIQNGTANRDVILQIEEDDVAKGVADFVRLGVHSLAAGRRLSERLETFMREKVMAKSGSLFQLARSLLTLLSDHGYDLGSEAKITQALDRFRPYDIELPYIETIERMDVEAIEKSAKVIRYAFFASWELTLDEMSDVLAIVVEDPSAVDFQSRIEEGLAFFLEAHCGNLINVSKQGQIRFRHSSVRDFFHGWPETHHSRGIFSCAHHEAGHLDLALLCVRYLLLWRDQSISVEEIETADGSEMESCLRISHFLQYAAKMWPYHVREAGKLIKPYLTYVDQLFDYQGPRYISMLYASDVVYGNIRSDWTPQLPAPFVASYNLVHIMEAAERRDAVESRERFRNFFNFISKQRTPSIMLIKSFDINLSERYEGGSTLLHIAAVNGATEVAQRLLEWGARGDLFDDDGATPFSMAVDKNQSLTAKLLIDHYQAYECRLDNIRVTSLHMAAFNNMEDVVIHLLKSKSDPNIRCLGGWTPVHVAATRGHLSIVRLLLKYGGKPDTIKSDGGTPLYLAASRGDISIIKELFAAKAGLDCVPLANSGITPLYAAAENGHVEAFDFLSVKWPTVEATTKQKWLPIHAAALNGHLEIATRLLDRENIGAVDVYGRTALHLAASGGHLDLVRKLCEISLRLGIMIDQDCRDMDVDSHHAPQYCITPLFLAVSRGHFEVVEFLVSIGASTKVTSFYGSTLLHQAAHKSSKVFNFLLLHGLDPCRTNLRGDFPFHTAAANGNVEVVEYYLELARNDSFNIDTVNVYNETALVSAIDGKQTEVALKLIEGNANCNLLDIGGRSPLMEAARIGDLAILETLLKHGVDVNTTDARNMTTLHQAVMAKRRDIAIALLEAGADKNAQTIIGDTPLMLAEGFFDTEMSSLLHKHNANTSIRNKLGFTALDITGKFIPPEEKEQLSKKCIKALVAKLPDHISETECGRLDVKIRLVLWTVLCYLSSCFHSAQKEADHRVCAEYFFERYPGRQPQSDFGCGWCLQNPPPPGAFSVCKICPGTYLCSECNEKRLAGTLPKGCAEDHEYWIIAGPDWENYPPKTINLEGDTLETWIARKKTEYGVVPNDTLESAQVSVENDHLQDWHAEEEAY